VHVSAIARNLQIMTRIRQLEPDVINKIAAGEVIERPASVVKELLENSIDAGAKRIDVEVEQGGIERMVVVDDGCGINVDDLELAFASHATSKLKSADDLFRVGTLGFRGEALASVGSVAQVTLQSRPAGHESGAEIQCKGTVLSPVKPWNGAPGTRIEVKHLFYNTPVRRKFLKTISTELGHISEAVTRLALAYPSLHMTLRHNGKPVYDVPATATLQDRIRLFFGPDIASNLYEIRLEQGPARIGGYIADPSRDRGNARMQYLFLNGRWIRDRALGHAIQEGYRGLLMTGRYAIAFLFLELPPDHVDVNVHPTKAEVRFRESSAMFHLVLSAIRSRLNEANLIPRLQLPDQEAANAEFASHAPQQDFATPAPLRASSSTALQAAVTPPSTATLDFTAPPPRPFDATAFQTPPPRHVAEPTRPEPAVHTLAPWNGNAKALQIHDAYLVLETSDGMLVIDQHALHERILFEQFKKRLKQGPIERQRLLVPEPVDLTSEQAARVLEAKAELAELGLEVEEFGGGTILVHSYPTLLSRLTPAAILREAVDFLAAQDRAPTREVLLNELMSMMACKAAVKAGDRLTSEQITALLEQRHLARDTHHCPHGRPTSLIFSRKELDKQFGRT
jgi:DNA mismatch repair protein MutL